MKRVAYLLVCAGILLAPIAQVQSATSVAEARDRLVAGGDAPFKVTAVLTARLTLPDGQAVVLLQEEAEPGLPVLLPAEAAAKVRPRDRVTLAGRPLNDGPLGFPVLAAEGASITVTATNRSIPGVEPRTAVELQDAAAFAGRYFVITNATFDLAEPKFTADRPAILRDATGEVRVLVSRGVDGRDKPAAPVNVFGAALPGPDGGWVLLPARFVPANSPAMRQLAARHTCITCHQPDVKVLGPAYRDVAARYAEDDQAVAKLVAQMETGGSGKWGPVPMLPFKGKVPPDEMQALAQWIMEMRWDTLLSL